MTRSRTAQSRRHALSLLAAGAAGILPPLGAVRAQNRSESLNAAETSRDEQPADASWEIVIIGAGGAGMTAAAAAAEAGAKRVLVLEKEPVFGGSSMISGGLWSVAGTELQRRNGIRDDAQRFEADLLRVGRFRNDRALVRAFVEADRQHYDWVRRTLRMEPVGLVLGEGIMRAHAFDAEELVARLRLYIGQLGVRVLTHCRAQKLLVDRKAVKPRITGVQCRMPDGSQRSFYAERGVLIASGGFSRNAALIDKYWPDMTGRVSSVAAQGSEGDGLLMGLACGSDLADMGYPQYSYPFRLRPSSITDMTLIPYSGAIIVNIRGERFVNESLPYKDVARRVLLEPGGRSWLVFDERIRRIAARQDLYPSKWRGASWDRRADWLAEGRSWREAAEKTEVPPDELERTIAAYNRALHKGFSDPYGRESLSGTDASARIALETKPCYLMPVTVALLGTYCGLKTDAQCRVIDVFGEPIPGLWAAGEVTGGFHGASFLMGTGFPKAMIFGRLAASSMMSGAQAA